LYVLAVYDDEDALLGIAPWYAESTSGGSRALRFLGSGEVCTDYSSILSTLEHEDAVAEVLARWLTAAAEPDSNRDPSDGWDLIELDGVSQDDSAINQLVGHLDHAGCAVHRQPGLNCWRVDLPQNWTDYVAGSPKSRRRKIRKFEAIVQEQGISLQVAQCGSELTEAKELLIRLHQTRRQSLGEPGCFASRPFAGFFADALGELGASGSMSVSWIEHNNRPIAVETYLTDGTTNYLYQSGVDPQALDLSPGHLSNMLLIQRSIEESRSAIDFLRGDEPYKSFWGAQPMATQKIRVAANRFAPRIRHGVWLAGVTMKGWIKSGMEYVATG
jgi:CelD/BcsL family acetyltransferase involved in cellulose biosynthesis